MTKTADNLDVSRKETDGFSDKLRVEQKETAEKVQSYEDQITKLNSLVDAQRARIQELEFKGSTYDKALEKVKADAAEAEKDAEDVIQTLKADGDAKVAELTAQIVSLKRAPRALSNPVSIRSSGSALADTAVSIVEGGLSITEIYTKYEENENLLAAERVKTSNLTATLERIAKDIEAKGPLILRQKREYQEAMQHVEEMSERLHEAEEYANQARVEVRRVEEEVSKKS